MNADGEDDVGDVEIATQGTLGEEPGAQREIAGVADGALALGRFDDAGLEKLGDSGERLVSAREMDTAARVDRGALGAQQHLGRPIDVGGRRRGARRMPARHERHVDLFFHRVPRHVDRDRPRPPAA